MATFKVGQRVRVVRIIGEDHHGAARRAVGREGLITRQFFSDAGLHFDWVVRIDNFVRLSPANGMTQHELPFLSGELEPLVDPGVDKFIESIKLMTKQPLTLVKEEELL